MESDAQIPLVDRAAIVIAASVWYHEDVVETIRQSISNKSYDLFYWINTERKVNENIDALPLTVFTKQRVTDFSAFIVKGIQKWMQDNYFVSMTGNLFFNYFCWNPRGVIDSIATVKKIISHEENILNRFRIACMYCLEDYAFQLWDEVKHHYLQNDTEIMECFEVKFWICYIKHDLRALMDEVEYVGRRDSLLFAFDISVTNDNAIWMEYFMKKLRGDQKCVLAYSKLKNILERNLTFNFNMIPLLSRYVSSEMLEDLILSYPGTFLLAFLQFPNTYNFLKIANKTWDVLPDKDFYQIIEKIGHNLQDYSGNQLFKNVAEEFWKNSPDHCKAYVIQKCIDGSFLHRLGLLKHSSPVIKLIIQSSTTDQRKEMVFSFNGILFFKSLTQKNRWGCFSMSFQEFVGSEDRENWINELINTYMDIFKSNQFPAFTYNDLEKLTAVFEKLKDKSISLQKQIVVQ